MATTRTAIGWFLGLECTGPFFHDWAKWQDGTGTYSRHVLDGIRLEKPIVYNLPIQMRECNLCGRKQSRRVKL